MGKIILILTTFLTISAYSQEVKLFTYSASVCDESIDIEKLQPRIISKELKNDTLIIKISTVANCNGIDNPVAIFKNDTLNIFYIEGKIVIDTLKNGKSRTRIEELCCKCCFEFSFSITSLNFVPKNIKVNNKIIRFHKNKYKLEEDDLFFEY
jgi:hypothetical protein